MLDQNDSLGILLLCLKTANSAVKTIQYDHGNPFYAEEQSSHYSYMITKYTGVIYKPLHQGSQSAGSWKAD